MRARARVRVSIHPYTDRHSHQDNNVNTEASTCLVEALLDNFVCMRLKVRRVDHVRKVFCRQRQAIPPEEGVPSDDALFRLGFEHIVHYNVQPLEVVRGVAGHVMNEDVFAFEEGAQRGRGMRGVEVTNQEKEVVFFVASFAQSRDDVVFEPIKDYEGVHVAGRGGGHTELERLRLRKTRGVTFDVKGTANRAHVNTAMLALL